MQQELFVSPSASLEAPLSYWQQTAPSPIVTSTLPAHTDVVVIGGGLLGATTAYWVARAGCKVVVLERNAPASGATGRNGGFVGIGPDEAYTQAIRRLGYETARSILNITRENRVLLHRVLAEEAIACDYREPGHLHLALTEEGMDTFAQSSLALQQEGVPTTLLKHEDLDDVIATPAGPAILGGLLLPQAGLVHPVKLVQGVLAAAGRSGAAYFTTTVQQLFADGEAIRVQTTHGSIHANRVIVAANAWLADVLPELVRLITPVRGQVLAYQPVAPLFSTGVGATLTDTEEYWQQTPDGTILVGGCRSVAEGRDIGIRDSQPTPAVQHALEQVLPSLFPHLPTLHVKQRWAGLMAFTPDLLPIADRAETLPNTWVVGGFSGHGMPYGFRFGQLLAEAVLSGQVPSALLPFRRDRVTLAQQE